MVDRGCRDWTRTQELLRGNVRGSDAMWLKEHLANCMSCVRAMRSNLEPGNSFTGSDPDIELSNLHVNVPGVEASWLSDFIDAAQADSHQSGAGESRPMPKFVKPPQAPGEIGRFGTYPILGILASDAHGSILLAEDAVLRRVTLHVLHPDLAANDRARRRFLRQAQAMATVSHDHIVPIYHVGEVDGLPFLVMPRLDGESLQDRLARDKNIAAVELARIGREIASGLAAAHQKGLIHRDLRPECIWLEAPRQRARILDFGLFRPVAVKGALSAPDAVPGSLAYLSPEQANGQPADARSDLYSLGCILYNAATGRPPFRGESLLGVLMSLQMQSPDPVVPFRSDLPVGFNELVLRLMAKEPDQRPADAAEVEAELARIADRAAEAADPFETVENVIVTTPMPADVRQPAARARSGPSPRRIAYGLAAGLALGLFLLAAGYGIRALQRETPVAPQSVNASDYASLKDAVAAVAPGGIVHVPAGIYREHLVLDRPVTLQSNGDGEVVITFALEPAIEASSPGVRLRGLTISSESNNALLVRSGGVDLEDCTLSSGSASSSVIYASGSGCTLTLKRCGIRDGRNAGIVIEERAHAKLVDCEITGNALAGIEGRLQAKLELTRCRVHANRATGVILSSFCEAQLDDCDIFGNGYTGAEVSREAHVFFRGCRIYEHGGNCGIYFYHQGRGELEDCDVFLNHTSGIEVTALSRVRVRRCGIHCNLHYAVIVSRRGEVRLDQCSLDDNTLGPIQADADCTVVETK